MENIPARDLNFVSINRIYQIHAWLAANLTPISVFAKCDDSSFRPINNVACFILSA